MPRPKKSRVVEVDHTLSSLVKEATDKLAADDAAELARLRAENERLRAKLNKPITFKVSEKLAVSVYGLGRWPITLYRDQWLKLIDVIPQLKEFIKANEGKLRTRDDREAA